MSACWDTTPRKQTPPRADTPLEQTPPPPRSRPPQSRHSSQSRPPPEQTSPQSRHPRSRHPPEQTPLGADTPPPQKRHTPEIRSLLRTVRILLECILVSLIFSFSSQLWLGVNEALNKLKQLKKFNTSLPIRYTCHAAYNSPESERDSLGKKNHWDCIYNSHNILRLAPGCKLVIMTNVIRFLDPHGMGSVNCHNTETTFCDDVFTKLILRTP